MARQNHPIHVCCFSVGLFDVCSEGGGQGMLFDDSDQFGPSKVHPRTGDLSPIPEGLRWFWKWYPVWRKAGRPLTGEVRSSPIGDIHVAVPAKDGVLAVPLNAIPPPPTNGDGNGG